MAVARVLLLSLMFIFFFGSSLVDYGLLPDAINSYVPEVLISALLFISISKCVRSYRAFQIPGKLFVILLIAQTIISSVVNEVYWLNGLLMLRALLRFYILFLALLNLRLSAKDLQRYVRIIGVLFIIQIPTAVYKLFIFGQGENAIGTYATHGGINSTTIPMIATGFLLTYYFTYRRSPWYIAWIFGFSAFGLIGGKKAIFIIVPVVCLFALWNARLYFSDKRRFPVVYFPLTILLMLIVCYIGVRAHPRLNPDGKFWGRFDLNYTINYSFEYSTVDASTTTGTRGGTMLRSFEHTNRDWSSRLCGLGPGRVMKSRFQQFSSHRRINFQGKLHNNVMYGLEIYYGLNGVSWLLLQIGYPGAIIWLGFFVYMFLSIKKMAGSEKNRFWKSFHLGNCCFTFTVLWISFTYSSVFMSSDLMPFLYYVLLAFSFLHHNQAKRLASSRNISGRKYAVQQMGNRL